MHPGIRNEVVAFLGEFCGTFLFLFSAFTALQTALDRNSAALDVIAIEPDDALAAAAAAARPDISTLLYVSMAFGFSLMVNCWIFYRVSGGMFNPAVSNFFFFFSSSFLCHSLSKPPPPPFSALHEQSYWVFVIRRGKREKEKEKKGTGTLRVGLKSKHSTNTNCFFL